MTVGDIITAVNMLEPNQYSAAQKKKWLSELDGQVYDELIASHEGAGARPALPYTALTDTLLIPSPYGEEIYNLYLQSMIALENSESARYRQLQSVFNGAYRQFACFINRTRRPLSPAGGSRFRF